MLKTTPFSGFLYAGITWILLLCGINEISGQSFSQHQVNFNGHPSVQSGTSLSFGPDGRLYVTEYLGQIKIYTLERESPGKYKVIASEVLTDIQTIPDHNDDGSPFTSPYRQTIGLTVVGTPEHPVFYVSSSDVRIGGGGGGGSGDVGLDTNSGVITRFTWTGEGWEIVDIVRGLPRSEENHATNAMEYVVINGEEYLLVSQGGNTNAGGPSANFAYTTEYALSAAVLSVNLTQLQSMPILQDNGRNYIYDLPTLDDPTRPNKNGIENPDAPGYDGIDVNDPWGGNDGLNQAMVVPGGPVQIFSPGYRNTFDLVVTQSGAVYVTDNGANGGWGGFPENEGMDGTATNNYLPGEPGSSSPSNGEKINNVDHLTLVTTDVNTYTFGSFYGGHPTPVRANPYGAGLYTNPAQTGTEGAVFRTLIYHPDKNEPGYTNDPSIGLPANWPPVEVANPVEGDWRGPGINNPDGPDDALVTTWGTNTNAIAEYTASNFGGVMKGNLLAGVNTGLLRRVELEPDGSLKALHSSFISGLGGDALGVTANGDDDIFPGTIWVVTLNGKLVAMEPQDFIVCALPGDPGYDPLADNDFDGYTNQDELDNGSDPCNGGSQPQDFDKEAGGVLISDLNDPDDDNDGIPDHEDPFQLGDPLKDGSDAFELPVINELFSSNPDLKGYMGLGMTGLMNNGDPGPNWLLWLDRRDDPNDPNPNDILGGAIGAMTMQMTAGTALGTSNNQEKGFQYGVQVDQSSGTFIVAGGLVNFYDPLQLYGNTAAPQGELGIFIGDGFQSDYIKFVMTPAGLLVQQESDDIPGEPILFPLSSQERPQGGMTLFLIVDPQTGLVELAFSRDNEPRVVVGTMMAQGKVLQTIQSSQVDLAVGMIGTSNQEGVEVEGTWDFLNVTPDGPYITQEIEDIQVEVGSDSIVINLVDYFSATLQSGLTYSLTSNTNPLIEVDITGSELQIIVPQEASQTEITVRAQDSQGRFVSQTFTITVEELVAVEILYRVNAGGPELAAPDGGMLWSADTKGNKSPYLSTAGNNMTYSGKINSYTQAVDQSVVPLKLFGSERYDNVPGAPNVTYSFPVPSPGFYQVRLYMGDGYSGTSQPGTRIFDVKLEGSIPDALKAVDLSSRFGSMVGGVVYETVEVNDGVLDIEFLHVVQNPVINGIEILGGAGVGDIPIVIEQIEQQVSYQGDQMDGSLVVLASGGQGNLNYSMTGQPDGIVIEPTNGLISGTIAPDAAELSPYTVVVTVDDSDEISSDAAVISFTWVVNTGEVVIVDQLPDISRQPGSPQEQIDLDNYFSIGSGSSLTYSITHVSDSLLGVSLEGHLLTLNFPPEPVTALVTVRATDPDDNFVEQSFEVQVSEVPVSAVLYRVNAGGPLVTSIDDEMDWGADTKGVKSPYLSQPARNLTYSGGIKNYTSEVDLTKVPATIFKTERYDDQPGPPNLTYSFPVPVPGAYEVRLYLGDGYVGTADPGKRIFSVKLEGVIPSSLDNIDLSSRFGNMVGGMVSHTVEVTDGVLDIEFLHGVQNPLINGIEILGGTPVDENAIVVEQLSDQVNYPGDQVNSLQVVANGGQGSLSYGVTGQPEGITMNATDGILSGTIAPDAAQGSPYSVAVTVNDEDPETEALTMNFTWTIHSGEPIVVNPIPDVSRQIGSPGEQINLDEYFSDNQTLVYSITQVSDTLLGVSLEGNMLTLSFPQEPVMAIVTVRATDPDDNFVEQIFEVQVAEVPVSAVLYRVNAGGPLVTSIDDEMDWGADTKGVNSPYLSQPARNLTYSGGIKNYTSEVDLTKVPTTIFKTERYDDQPGPPNLTYSFPVPVPGAYEVRLYLGDGYVGTADPGKRIFSVKLEGIIPSTLDNIDLSSRFGNMVGGMVSHTVEVTDGVLDIEFLHGVQNPLINGIEILGGTPVDEDAIVVEQLPDQVNYPGDQVNSLQVMASGGLGSLSYSITGQPEGIIMNASDGILSGTIAQNAPQGSPYSVTVTVTDEDPETEAGTMSFTWTIPSGEPVIANPMPDISRQTGSPQEQINLDDHFSDNQTLVYSITQVSDSLLGVSLEGHLLTLNFPPEPVTALVTVRATDPDDNFVEQSFEVQVSEVPVSAVLYRVNAGGPLVASIDEDMDWGADTKGVKSQYLVEAARNMTFSGKISSYTSGVDLSRIPTTLFKTERYDDLPGPPNFKYAFPVPEPGIYQVNLYMGDGYTGTAAVGARIFNVNIEGNSPPSLQNIDLSSKFGNLVGGVISYNVEVLDGLLEIEFLHQVQNPLINGIEILRSSGEGANDLEVAPVLNQTSVAGEPIPTGLKVSASGGQGTLAYSMEGAPDGVSMDPHTGVISGVIHPSAGLNSPYQVTVTVQDATESVSISYTWVVNSSVNQPWTLKGENTNYTPRHENSFVQAGDKFYLMGGRENARTIDVYDYNSDTWTALVNSAPVEFNHFQATEYQGLIWIIGAFKTNTYPQEAPADHVWIFDPVNKQWIQGPEIPQGRRRGSAGLVVYEDKFYIIGGNTQGHNGGYVSWFDQYDPKTGVWTPLDDAPRARDHFHAQVIDGRLYAVGGRLSGGSGGTFKPVISEVDVYDFQTGHWSVLPADLPTPRAGAAVAHFNDQLIVIGGEIEQELVYGTYRDDALEVTEAYDPQTGRWSRWGDLNYKRHGTQAIVSGEGLYVLAGSPNKGGGNQKHMEYLGVDNPMGIPLTSGSLQGPGNVQLTQGNEESVVIHNNGGNIGIFINSVSISGADAAQFELREGAFTNVLLAPGDSLAIGVIYNGTMATATASLDLQYAGDKVISIPLESIVEDAEETGQTIVNAFNAQLVPNPVLSDAVLSLEVEQEVNGIQIYSFNGSLLQSFEPKKIALGNGRFNLQMSNLPMGMYFVRVYSGEAVQTLQFIKR